jgi:hypothetical protein
VSSADFARPRSKIDKLPPILKTQVIDAMLAGVPLRKIAAVAGCDVKGVKTYRDRYILPILQARDPLRHGLGEVEPQQPQQTPTSPQHAVEVEPQTRLTGEQPPRDPEAQGLIRSTPVRQRTERLWARTERVLDRVESRADEDFSGREWAAVATVAHRNAELLGRLTGELHDRSGPGDVNIQILMPTSVQQAEVKTIDVDVIEPIII